MVLGRKSATFFVVLIGNLFYCYNFNVVDYIRPYLVERYAFSLADTANLTVAQNIGVTVGAFAWAAIVGKIGYRSATVAIFFSMGAIALLFPFFSSYPAWLMLRGLLSATLGGFYVVTTAVIVAQFRVDLRARLIALTSTTYPLSNILLGLIGGRAGDDNWVLLLWIAAAPLLLAPLAFVIPADRKCEEEVAAEKSASWGEMLAPRWRWRTLGCTFLAGLDFIAYGLAAGFLTTYLKAVRHMDASWIGFTVALMSVGSILGALFWAWLSDRRGRRWGALGYLTAAAALIPLLFVSTSLPALTFIVIAFGFGLACNSAWGAWYAELFPDHLRSHGAALFHAGHIIAMAGPIFVTIFTERLGLVLTMATAAPVYVAGAILWLNLPETLERRIVSPETSDDELEVKFANDLETV
jgi:MFS family permease